MKHCIYIIMCTLVALLASSCSDSSKSDTQSTSVKDSLEILTTRIQQCSKLYVAECKVHKIITHEDELRWKGKIAGVDYDLTLPLGERKVAIPMDATMKAFVDFGSFSETNIHRHGDKIEILLPNPEITVTSVKINHNDIRKDVALLRSNFSDKELATYEQQGRKDIVNATSQLGIIEKAQLGATHVLVPLIRNLGYKEENIIITFSDDVHNHPQKYVVPFDN